MIRYLNLFPDLISYINVFHNHLGKKIYLIVFFVFFASIFESLGIVMLLPIVENLGGSDKNSFISNFISGLLPEYFTNNVSSIFILILAAFIIKAFFYYLSLFSIAKLRGTLVVKLKKSLYQKFLNMTFNYYTSKNTGHFINILNEQSNKTLEAFYFLSQFLTFLVNALVYLTFALISSWQFGISAILFGVMCLMLLKTISKYVQNLSRNRVIEASNLSKLIIQSLQSFKYLLSTSTSEKISKKINKSINNLTNLEVKTGVAAAFSQSIREPLAATCIILIILVQVNLFNVSLSNIIVSIILFYRGFNSIMHVQGSWQNFMSNVGSLEIIDSESKLLEINQENSGHLEDFNFEKEIVFKNVSFRYPGNKDYSLKNINMKIPKNSVIAFIGHSGAGKSTLIDMLTLLNEPDEGEIMIDNHNSFEIKKNKWRKNIGYVSQDIIIFDDTIKNNISLWDEITGDKKLEQNLSSAIKYSDMEKFIYNLEKNINTDVGERGVKLSGGQKQRLFIARELYRKPNIILLDEATSSLDPETEVKIRENISRLRNKATFVLITHRISLVNEADFIYEMENGKIKNSGTFDELKKKKSSIISKDLT